MIVKDWMFMFYTIIVGVGCGIFYYTPSPVTFGCMAADVFMSVLVILLGIAERIAEWIKK